MRNMLHKRWIVNPKLQGTLLLRVIIYWLACIATMEFFSLAWMIATGPDQPTFADYFLNYDWHAVGGRLLLAALVLVPIIFDIVIFSNRFAGPIFRFRGILRGIAQGDAVEPLQLQRGEYWQGLVDDLNAALKHLASQRNLPPVAATGHDEPKHGLDLGAMNAGGLNDTLFSR